MCLLFLSSVGLRLIINVAYTKSPKITPIDQLILRRKRLTKNHRENNIQFKRDEANQPWKQD